MTPIVHIAGVALTVDTYQRQRCGWCGAVLHDADLANLAVPVGQDPTPATWPVGALVEVYGAFSCVVEHEDGARLPSNACAQLDPAATK